jgi:hypothetical protein
MSDYKKTHFGCGFCRSAKDPDYKTCFIRDKDGKTVCPTILGHMCTVCLENGHFEDYCPTNPNSKANLKPKVNVKVTTSKIYYDKKDYNDDPCKICIKNSYHPAVCNSHTTNVCPILLGTECTHCKKKGEHFSKNCTEIKEKMFCPVCHSKGESREVFTSHNDDKCVHVLNAVCGNCGRNHFTNHCPEPKQQYMECTHCKKSGEPKEVYTSHFTKEAPGSNVITCPKLRKQKGLDALAPIPIPDVVFANEPDETIGGKNNKIKPKRKSRKAKMLTDEEFDKLPTVEQKQPVIKPTVTKVVIEEVSDDSDNESEEEEEAYMPVSTGYLDAFRKTEVDEKSFCNKVSPKLSTTAEAEAALEPERLNVDVHSLSKIERDVLEAIYGNLN